MQTNNFLFHSVWFFRNSENSTNLDKFHLGIKQNELYSEDSTLVDNLLHDMATQPISHVGKYVLNRIKKKFFSNVIDEKLKICKICAVPGVQSFIKVNIANEILENCENLNIVTRKGIDYCCSISNRSVVYT